MKNLKQYLNYGFEIYNENGGQIDKIYGPGEIGFWLLNPDESPMFAAIIPAPYEKAIIHRDKNLFNKIIRIPLDEKGNEIKSGKEEMVLFNAKNEQDAKELAQESGCDYMYWSEWDPARVMVIIDVKSKEEWHKSNYETYYFDE